MHATADLERRFGARRRAACVALAGALALAAGGGGCGFAVRHPAVTAGLVAGTLTLGTCELESPEHGTCFAAAGIAGAALGLIAAGALWLGSSGEDSVLQPPPEPAPPIRPAQQRPAGAPATAATGPAANVPGAPAANAPAGPAASAPAVIPDYLKEPPQLMARAGAAIVPAPPGDQAVAASYARSPVRGPLKDGVRITILTERTKYKVGEEVRVIHVLEAPEPGHELYVMGPKAIYSEYVDGVERTPPPSGTPGSYDGRVLPSPGVDWNYEVTVYRLQTPGPHRVQWRADGRESNVIEVEVAP
jgi:hypothetical protein